jgi:hypothetical protein
VLKTLWRINVPQLAFSHDFVMRGILAVSALHLAHFKPAKRDFYVAQAMQLHQTALGVAMSILPHVTADNCSALYIFSVLTCIFALARPRSPDDFLLVGEAGIAEWLFLLRGTRSILNLASETLHSSTLAPIFSVGMRREELHVRASDSPNSSTNNNEEEEDHLSSLQSYINITTTPPHTHIYTTAISGLRRSYAVAADCGPRNYELSDAFIWAFRVSDEYLSLLRQRAPEALAILAYFCVLLKRLDGHWWTEGCSVHLVERIYYLLDEEQRLWIRWPIEEIGWVPS